MTTVQILLITLIAYWKMTDNVTLQLFAFNTIICGWLVGLVMGFSNGTYNWGYFTINVYGCCGCWRFINA